MIDRIDLQEYAHLRAVCKDIHTQAVRIATDQELHTAARELGVLRAEKVLALDSEEEMSVLVDYLLYEVRRGDAPVVRHFLRQSPLAGRAGAVSTAMLQAYTSFFRVEDVRDDRLLIHDVLKGDQPPVVLVDIGLTRTGAPGLFLFLRLLPLPTYCIASGASFAFSESGHGRLIRSYLRKAYTWEEHEASRRRYRYFFQASRQSGLPVEYA